MNQQWKPACTGETMLVLDVHRAQKTAGITALMEELKTTSVYVPPGTTCLIQPLDVVINAPFKAAIDRLSTQHVQQNLEAYVRGSIPATERRVLFTKWVGEAWEQVASNRGMIVRAFQKCGISLPIDGSRDDEINIQDLQDYSVGEDTDDGNSTDDADPFEGLD